MATNYHGQQLPTPAEAGALALSTTIMQVVGQAATVLFRPYSNKTNPKVLYVSADRGGFRVALGDRLLRNFTVANQATGLLTITGHNFHASSVANEGGLGPYRVTNSGGALPTGLLVNTDYYIKYVDANTVQILNQDRRPVSLSSNGTGTQTLTNERGAMVTSEFPAASVTDGTAAIYLREGAGIMLGQPESITVAGFADNSVLTYWWA